MSDIDRILGDVSAAMCEGRFTEAEQTLKASLLTCDEEGEIDLLLQELVHLYAHKPNRDVEKAQAYMDLRETRHPRANIALSQANFHLHVRSDTFAARHWTETAIERARTEEDWCTLYSASAMNGFLARNSDDRAAVINALEMMEYLVGKDEFISYGDAVLLLEMVAADDEVGPRARHLARQIAPLITDDDFRMRTEALGRLA